VDGVQEMLTAVGPDSCHSDGSSVWNLVGQVACEKNGSVESTLLRRPAVWSILPVSDPFDRLSNGARSGAGVFGQRRRGLTSRT
jgi:hypothetical protein